MPEPEPNPSPGGDVSGAGSPEGGVPGAGADPTRAARPAGLLGRAAAANPVEPVAADPAAAERRAGGRRTASIWARLLLAADLAGTLLVVWLPARDAERVTGLVSVVASFVAGLGVGYEDAYDALEFLANVAFFVPFGVLLPAAAPRLRGPLVVLAGFAFSCCIELGQLAIPSRVATWSDVIANTLGALLGWLAWTVGRRLPRLRRP